MLNIFRQNKAFTLMRHDKLLCAQACTSSVDSAAAAAAPSPVTCRLLKADLNEKSESRKRVAREVYTDEMED